MFSTGMTRNQILEKIYLDKTFPKMCKAFTRYRDWEELYSIFLLIVCETKEEKLYEVYYANYINNWCCQILVNQYYSDSSQFWKQFRKSTVYTTDNIEKYDSFDEDGGADRDIILAEDAAQSKKEQQNLIKKINQIVDSQHWYDQQIFRLYLEKNSIRKLAKETGIKPGAIHKTVKKVKDQIKQQIKT